ncbi:SUMO protein smt3 [Exophiala xenobiotica]|nr:SUMO protein smt3 [Exophiala xenobiotica]KAK5336984.1 SUMO protein smt3 [Exophiala xenobiotica]
MAPTVRGSRAGATSLHLRVVDGELQYSIWVQKTWKMSKAMGAFWAVSCKRPHPALFTFRGQKLRAHLTPEMMKMNDGDTIHFQSTGQNPKVLLLENLITLTESCEQVNNGLKKTLELSSRRFKDSWNGTSGEFFLNRAELELRARLESLQDLRTANMQMLFELGASRYLGNVQQELTTYLSEVSILDRTLAKAAFIHCAVLHGKDAVDLALGKMCILGVENMNTLRKTIAGLNNAHLWPEFRAHIVVEIAGNHNQQDTDSDDVSMTDEEDVCAVCYDPVGKAEQAENAGIGVAACCKKPFHARCLAEWYAHSIYNMALTNIAEAHVNTPGSGLMNCWVSYWLVTVAKMISKDAEVVRMGADGITAGTVPERRGSA